MKRRVLLFAILIGICSLSASAAASEAGAKSGFSFDARTLKLGSWLDDYDFTGFDAVGKNGIIDENGFTSDSTKSQAILDLHGFKVETPSKIQIMLDGSNQREIELRSNGSLVCSASTVHNVIDFQSTGVKPIGQGRPHLHVFEISERGIRLTSNGAFINAQRIRTDAIDQIIIRGLSAHHKSHVLQVSAMEDKKGNDKITPTDENKNAGRDAAAKEEVDTGGQASAGQKTDPGRKSAAQEEKDSGQNTVVEEKTDAASRAMQILTE